MQHVWPVVSPLCTCDVKTLLKNTSVFALRRKPPTNTRIELLGLSRADWQNKNGPFLMNEKSVNALKGNCPKEFGPLSSQKISNQTAETKNTKAWDKQI